MESLDQDTQYQAPRNIFFYLTNNYEEQLVLEEMYYQYDPTVRQIMKVKVSSNGTTVEEAEAEDIIEAALREAKEEQRQRWVEESRMEKLRLSQDASSNTVAQYNRRNTRMYSLTQQDQSRVDLVRTRLQRSRVGYKFRKAAESFRNTLGYLRDKNWLGRNLTSGISKKAWKDLEWKRFFRRTAQATNLTELRAQGLRMRQRVAENPNPGDPLYDPYAQDSIKVIDNRVKNLESNLRNPGTRAFRRIGGYELQRYLRTAQLAPRVALGGMAEELLATGFGIAEAVRDDMFFQRIRGRGDQIGGVDYNLLQLQMSNPQFWYEMTARDSEQRLSENAQLAQQNPVVTQQTRLENFQRQAEDIARDFVTVWNNLFGGGGQRGPSTQGSSAVSLPRYSPTGERLEDVYIVSEEYSDV